MRCSSVGGGGAGTYSDMGGGRLLPLSGTAQSHCSGDGWFGRRDTIISTLSTLARHRSLPNAHTHTSTCTYLHTHTHTHTHTHIYKHTLKV